MAFRVLLVACVVCCAACRSGYEPTDAGGDSGVADSGAADAGTD